MCLVTPHLYTSRPTLVRFSCQPFPTALPTPPTNFLHSLSLFCGDTKDSRAVINYWHSFWIICPLSFPSASGWGMDGHGHGGCIVVLVISLSSPLWVYLEEACTIGVKLLSKEPFLSNIWPVNSALTLLYNGHTYKQTIFYQMQCAIYDYLYVY